MTVRADGHGIKWFRDWFRPQKGSLADHPQC
jgi:hypothetical protein